MVEKDDDNIVDIAEAHKETREALQTISKGLPKRMLELSKKYGIPLELHFSVDDLGLTIEFTFAGKKEVLHFDLSGKRLE